MTGPRSFSASPRIAHAGPLAAVELEGELDLHAVPGMDDALALATDLPGVEALVIDLSEVQFADSTLVNWLLCSQDRLDRMQIALVVLAGAGRTLDLLRLTGATDRLRVLPAFEGFVAV